MSSPHGWQRLEASFESAVVQGANTDALARMKQLAETIQNLEPSVIAPYLTLTEAGYPVLYWVSNDHYADIEEDPAVQTMDFFRRGTETTKARLEEVALSEGIPAMPASFAAYVSCYFSTKIPHSVQIVKARTKGITGYASLARGTGLGNPYRAGQGGCTDPVESYRRLFYGELGGEYREAAAKLLDRDWQDGAVRIACPCNGTFKCQPCHASVIKEYLERLIRLRQSQLQIDLEKGKMP